MSETFDLSEFYDDGDKCEDTFGDITSSTFESYYKYVFSLKVTTDKGYEILADFGGDHDKIYRFDPSSPDWCEVLRVINVKKIE